MNRIEYLVHHHQLLSHPEGGFYKETYRSKDEFLPAGFDGMRNYSTAIYFLITYGNYSAFHRIKSDECWHFYEGSALHIHVIDANGMYQLIKVGNNIEAGELYQCVVPAGAWFSSEVVDVESYAFVGCTVSPGFDFQDFELAEQKELIQTFPDHEYIIKKLTRN